MDSPEPFGSLYPPHQGTPFEGDESLCESASDFLAVTTKLLSHLSKEVKPVIEADRPGDKQLHQALIAINTAKVQLLDSFFEARRLAPKSCQMRIRRGDDHTCIFTVFEETYQEIAQLKLPIMGPIFELPKPAPLPPPPPTQRVEYVPLFLGEEN
jgi:hypothetical protein